VACLDDAGLAPAHDGPVRRDLPSGTVTFLFTDVEGSTKLLDELGADAYAQALAEHRRVLRESFARHGGVEVDTQGDAFFVAFPTAPGAVAAAQESQEGLGSRRLRVRMGIHTGTPVLAQEGYVGADVHRAARIAACGHGGQVLVSAATAALVGTEDLHDLGEHRLKDLSAPERIYQIGNAEFPPLKSLHQTNLPLPSTPFLGRDMELADLLGLLSRDNVHLLTLTGPGGTGKTRLAAQAAGVSADRYRDGVWWVPLASLRDPQLVLETAGRVLGAKGDVAAHIGDASILLLFDNFEQVVEAAPDVSGLLASCVNLDVLVTSREPLHVTGEWEYPVPPLVHEEGVTFFLARATAVRPDFDADDAVSEICQRLDDLPLAIELAAARVKALSPRQILERLDQRLPLLTGGARDLPERQRTLRATIEWSHDLLLPDEQRLFARLAVFRGGCTLDAAEGAAEADVDTLQSLVDKSLLRHREDRFWMLETIREYAVDRLERSGEPEELRRRHAEYFLALAEEAEPHLRGNPKEWLDRLEREHDNFRATLDRLEASGETELALRLAGALQRFWYLRGLLAEGRRRLESALAADERPSLARARALNGVALLALDSGDASTMKRRNEEALALHLELGDAWGAAVSRFQLGHAVLDLGEVRKAQRLFEESVQRFRELGDEHYTLVATHGLAFSHYQLGDLDTAQALHEGNLRRAREISNPRLQARSLAQLSLIAVDQGRLAEAFSMLRDAYRIDREVGEAVETALDLCRFARALASSGRAGDAVRLLSRAEAFREEIGATFRPWAVRLNEETIGTVRSQIDEATFAKAWEDGRKLTLDEAAALALASVE
jgi:predicted ATPase/class 3 adenylate cyclase